MRIDGIKINFRQRSNNPDNNMPNNDYSWTKRHISALSSFNKHLEAVQGLYSFKIGIKYDSYKIQLPPGFHFASHEILGRFTSACQMSTI